MSDEQFFWAALFAATVTGACAFVLGFSLLAALGAVWLVWACATVAWFLP